MKEFMNVLNKEYFVKGWGSLLSMEIPIMMKDL